MKVKVYQRVTYLGLNRLLQNNSPPEIGKFSNIMRLNIFSHQVNKSVKKST